MVTIMLNLLPLRDGTIVKWLRSNHSIYVTRYEKRPLVLPTEELVSIQNTIKRNLDRLVEIELLQIVGEEKIQTGDRHYSHLQTYNIWTPYCVDHRLPEYLLYRNT